MTEYLVLLGSVALVVMAAVSRFGFALSDAVQREARIIASFDQGAASGPGSARAGRDGRGEPAFGGMSAYKGAGAPESSRAPAGPSAPTPPAPSASSPRKEEDGPLQRGLGWLGDAYDKVAGAVPEAVEPIVRQGAQTAIGIGFDVASKLPDSVKDRALGVPELALDGLNVAVQHAPGPIRDKLGSKVADLADVDIQDFREDEGLEGDWYRLYEIWLTESRPSDLGVWSKDERGEDVVTITDPRYARDLESRPQHQRALDEFRARYPNPKPGDRHTSPFRYIGDETREGANRYNAVESFLGTYETEITYVGRNPATGKDRYQIVVTNESHWESGTRIPGSQQIEGRDHIVPDTPRGEKLGIGGDFHQRFVWTQEVDPP